MALPKMMTQKVFFDFSSSLESSLTRICYILNNIFTIKMYMTFKKCIKLISKKALFNEAQSCSKKKDDKHFSG